MEFVKDKFKIIRYFWDIPGKIILPLIEIKNNTKTKFRKKGGLKIFRWSGKIWQTFLVLLNSIWHRGDTRSFYFVVSLYEKYNIDKIVTV
jgi:hypothetical protein